MSWLPLTGFDFAGLVDWLLLAPRSWEPPSRSTPFSRFVTFWRCARCELESPLVPSLTAALLGKLPSGVTASLPLVLHLWTVLSWSHLMSLGSVSDRFMVVPRQLVGLGVCSPASPICPPSRVMKQRSFGSSASLSLRVFAMRSPFRVKSVSGLDRNEGSSSTFLVFGWSLRDEAILTGRVFLRSRSERRLFAHLP